MAEKDDLSVAPGAGMKMTVFGIKKKFPSVKNINTAMLSAWIGGSSETTQTGTTVLEQNLEQQKLVILDARPVEEYEISHISGAIRVDHSEEAGDILSKIPDISDTVPPRVVCYCSVGYRSSVVAEKLSKHFKQQDDSKSLEVYNLEGSIFQWANENRPLVDGRNQPTKYAHPYNAFFGKLLNSDLRKDKL